jgi:hypothetical protein
VTRNYHLLRQHFRVTHRKKSDRSFVALLFVLGFAVLTLLVLVFSDFGG